MVTPRYPVPASRAGSRTTFRGGGAGTLASPKSFNPSNEFGVKPTELECLRLKLLRFSLFLMLLNMRGSLFSAVISVSNTASLLRRQSVRTLGRQQVTKRHLSRNNAAIMGSSEGSNAWVGVKGAGSLDLRSETHCFELFIPCF